MPPRYVYTECASKKSAGGLAQLRVKNKVVPIDAVPEAGNCCLVYVHDHYMQRFQGKRLRRTIPSQPWFHTIPVGKNLLGQMVKKIYTAAAIVGQKTNHSL